MHLNGQKCYVKEQTLARSLSKKMACGSQDVERGSFWQDTSRLAKTEQI